MSLDISTLGEQQVSNIGRGLEEDKNLDRSFTDELCYIVPADQITAIKGVIKAFDLPSVLSDSATADTVADVALDAGGTPNVGVALTDRGYQLRKARAKTDYPEGLKGTALFNEVEKFLYPLVDRRIKHGLDTILGGIMRGEGLLADFRDVTKLELSATTNETFDDDASDPLGVFEAAAKSAFCMGPQGILVLSHDRAKVLKSHPQIVQSVLGAVASRAKVTDAQLSDLLSDHLNGMEIWIGDRQYQDGAVTDALKAEFLFTGVCYIGHKNNIQYRDKKNYQAVWEYFDDDTDVVNLKGKRIYDINTVYPEMSVAIVDVA